MFNPDNDGIDHINVYSKGKTELGRFLSNFQHWWIDTEDGAFASIEGYWYWLSTKDERLRDLAGYEAKKLGRELRGKDWVEDPEFKRKILAAIDEKLSVMPTSVWAAIKDNNLPLAHYYNYKGKVVEPKEGQWVIEFIQKRLNEIKEMK